MTSASTESVAAPQAPAISGGNPCLHEDLVLRAEPDGGGWILRSEADGQERSISFGPQEFQFAEALDGTRTLEEIRDALAQKPGLEALCIEHLHRMLDWMRDMELLAPACLEIGAATASSPTRAADDAKPADEVVDSAAAENVQRGPMERRVMHFLARAACAALLIGGAYFGVGWLRSEGVPELLSTASSQSDDSYVCIEAHFDGVVRELYVRDGDKVEAGELLGMVDNLAISRRLEALRGELEACQSRRDLFYDNGRMRDYRREVEHMADITRTIGQLRLEDESAELRAPFAGVIRSVDGHDRRVGEQVAQGQELLAVERVESEISSPFLVTSTAGR